MRKFFNENKINKGEDKLFKKTFEELSKTKAAINSGIIETKKYYNQIEQLGNLVSNNKFSKQLEKVGVNNKINKFLNLQNKISSKVFQAKNSIQNVERFIGIIKQKHKDKKGGDEAWFNQADPNYRRNKKSIRVNNNDTIDRERANFEKDRGTTPTIEYTEKQKEFIKNKNLEIQEAQRELNNKNLKPKEKKEIEEKIKKLSQQLEKEKNNNIVTNQKEINKNRETDSLNNNTDINNTENEILLTPPGFIPDDSIANVTIFEDLTNGLGDKIFKSWVSNMTPKFQNTLKQPFWQTNADRNRALRELPGSFKFYIEKLHGFDTNGQPYKANNITDDRFSKETAERLQNRMVFPVFLETWNESYTVNNNTTDLIGRSEPILSYNNTTRQLTIDFFVLADFSSEIMLAGIEELHDFALNNYPQKNDNTVPLNKFYKDRMEQEKMIRDADLNYEDEFMNDFLKKEKSKLSEKAKFITGSSTMTITEQQIAENQLKAYVEQFTNWGSGSNNISDFLRTGNFGFTPSSTTSTPEMLWNRLTFLAQCCYPYYRQDGKMKEAPIIKLRIGDFFDVIGAITSLNISDAEFGWDLNYSTEIGVIPMGAKVTINIDIIHNHTPSSTYTRFYYRKDYDKYNDPFSYIPQTTLMSISKDKIIDKILNDQKEKDRLFNTVNTSNQGGLISVSKDSKLYIDEDFDVINSMQPEYIVYDMPSVGNQNKEEKLINQYAENMDKLSKSFSNLRASGKNTSKNNLIEFLDVSKQITNVKEKMKDRRPNITPEMNELNKIANDFKNKNINKLPFDWEEPINLANNIKDTTNIKKLFNSNQIT